MLLFDGTTVDASLVHLDTQLLDSLRDTQWAVRSIAVRSLSTYMRTSFDEDHEPLLADALAQLLDLKDDSKVLPRAAVVVLQHGGGATGLGSDRIDDLSGDPRDFVPTPYASPAFEMHVSALHAIRNVGHASSICRDSALLLMMITHGIDASQAVLPSAV